MAIDPSIRIDLLAEFVGRKAFKQADTATAKLTKNVKGLAAAFGLAFTARAVVNFSKQSVKAFAADEAAAQRLTTAVVNLGLGFQDMQIKQFIQSLETSSAVLDEQLRPAMQALLLQTGSVVKSQELLRLSIDTAAGSGVDLQTVVNDIAQAYIGNVKGLKKYYLGLTQAEIKAASFVEIQEKLNKQFSGANAYYLTTYAGQISQLNVAADNAKETIGKGLVDALVILGGSGGIQTLVDGMEKAAKNAASFSANLALIFRRFKAGATFNLKELKEIQVLYDKLNAPPQMFGGVYGDQYKATAAAAAAAAEKLITDKIKADKLAADNKIKADKLAAANKAKLDKAAAVFDLQKIQIAAALKGKISEEEKVRLLLMQAIEEGNADKAEELANKLQEILEKNIEIADALAVIGLAKDPFSTWAGSLSLALVELAKYGKTMADINATTFIPGVNFNPTQNADRNYDAKVAAVTAATAVAKKVTQNPTPTLKTKNPFAGLGGSNSAAEKAAAEAAAALAAAPTNSTQGGGISFNPSQNKDRNVDSGNTTITIVVEGNVLDGDDFTQKVNDALLNANRTGMPQTPAGFLID